MITKLSNYFLFAKRLTMLNSFFTLINLMILNVYAFLNFFIKIFFDIIYNENYLDFERYYKIILKF